MTAFFLFLFDESCCSAKVSNLTGLAWKVSDSVFFLDLVLTVTHSMSSVFFSWSPWDSDGPAGTAGGVEAGTGTETGTSEWILADGTGFVDSGADLLSASCGWDEDGLGSVATGGSFFGPTEDGGGTGMREAEGDGTGIGTGAD